MALTPELVRDIRIGKNAHYHSFIRGKEIGNKVTVYTKENNDFFNYETGEHEEKICWVCHKVSDELYCFDQRTATEYLCCSEECYDKISLEKRLQESERVHRFEKMAKRLDEFLETL
tara:strand:+ start:73 stop:423 length:351 start_codon:yes stop_codon:yes gene_type:complete